MLIQLENLGSNSSSAVVGGVVVVGDGLAPRQAFQSLHVIRLVKRLPGHEPCIPMLRHDL